MGAVGREAAVSTTDFTSCAESHVTLSGDVLFVLLVCYVEYDPSEELDMDDISDFWVGIGAGLIAGFFVFLPLGAALSTGDFHDQAVAHGVATYVIDATGHTTWQWLK